MARTIAETAFEPVEASTTDDAEAVVVVTLVEVVARVVVVGHDASGVISAEPFPDPS